MGWMVMDSSSDEDEPRTEPAPAPAPAPAPPPSKRAKVSATAAPAAPAATREDKSERTDAEELQALYRRYVQRYTAQGLAPADAHARLTKTFGAVLTLDEVERLAHEARAAPPAARSTTTSTNSDATTAAAAAAATEEKHMGRPADAEQQRVILETVEHNPRVSLRTVAAAVGCSKSQVARVLALNGFQRNKGRVGEWQRAPLSPQAVAAAAAEARAVAAAAARAWRAGKREERLMQQQRQHELARQLGRE